MKHKIAGITAVILGIIFVIAGTGKLLLGHTAFTLPDFVPQVLAEAIYTSLPYIEIVIGGLLISGIAVRFAASLSLLLILCFAVTNIYFINLGATGCSSCFGVFGMLTPVNALIIDGVMYYMALFVACFYKGKFFNLTPWLLESVNKGRGVEYV